MDESSVKAAYEKGRADMLSDVKAWLTEGRDLARANKKRVMARALDLAVRGIGEIGERRTKASAR